jgi:hypothetical protein
MEIKKSENQDCDIKILDISYLFVVKLLKCPGCFFDQKKQTTAW